MADRYQDRPFPAHDDHGRGRDQHDQTADSDPLAELARLIGQNDPFAMGRGNANAQPQSAERYQAPQYQEPQYEPEQYEPEQYEPEQDERPAGPPPWMQRANARVQQSAPLEPQYDDEADYQPAPVHPLQRYGGQQAAPPPPPPLPPQQAHYQYAEEPQYAEQQPADPARYDDALYGQIEQAQDYQRDPAYPDDPYAYQNYDDEQEEQPRKRGGMITVAAVLALAVLGTGGAFAYRNFVGSPRSGDVPVIKADPNPTRVVPAQADNAPKSPDRMTFGDGNEKIVPREESPVDVNARSGPRVVFPPLNQNANPPSPSSVATSAPPSAPATANGVLSNSEPKRVRTLSVKGDAADAGMPAGAPKQGAAPPAQVAPPRAQAPAAPAARTPPSSANASANAPLSLAPGAPAAAEPPARVAAVAPAAPAAEGGGGNFVVSVASQDSEAAAREAFRVAQGKYASVLASRSPLIKRVDMPDGKVKYRATIGPYRTRQEAVQFCTELKAAGGQCFIPN
jgi:SPOR domain